jgi:hypothetical protein
MHGNLSHVTRSAFAGYFRSMALGYFIDGATVSSQDTGMGKIPEYLRQAWPKVRQFARQELTASLKLFTAAGSTYRGWCKDVSEGGIGATIAAPIRAGE